MLYARHRRSTNADETLLRLDLAYPGVLDRERNTRCPGETERRADVRRVLYVDLESKVASVNTVSPTS